MPISLLEKMQDLPLSTDIATQEELAFLSGEVVDGLSVTVNPKLSTIADLVSAEVERVDAISGDLNDLSSQLGNIAAVLDAINGVSL